MPQIESKKKPVLRRAPNRAFFVLANCLLADLPADSVFLLIQGFLFLLGNVATILRSHRALFLANLTVFPMQFSGLAFGHVASFHFLLDPLVLIGKAFVDFGAARVIFLPVVVGGESAGSHTAQHKGGSCENDVAGCAVHDQLPPELWVSGMRQ